MTLELDRTPVPSVRLSTPIIRKTSCDELEMFTIPQLLELNRQLRDDLTTGWQKWVSGPEDGKYWPVGYFAGKALTTHEAILVLAERGLGQDAGILTRSLYELSVNTHLFKLHLASLHGQSSAGKEPIIDLREASSSPREISVAGKRILSNRINARSK